MDAYTSAATMWSDASSTPRMVQADVSPLPNPDPADQLITPGRGGTGTALRIVYAGIYQEAHAWDTHNAPYTGDLDRKSTRLNSSHSQISYAVFCLKKKKTQKRHN